jgi:hypothetical protein
MTDGSEYLEYVSTPADGELSQLQTLAEDQALAEKEVRAAERALAKAEERLKDLSERQIPELMDKIGVEEFKTASGLSITVRETIRANIPKDRAEEALKWLTDNGHGSLIGRVISVALHRGEDDKARMLHQLLDDKFEVDEKQGVHAQTLSAFVRERLREGAELPTDLLGVHRQRVSKVALPK